MKKVVALLGSLRKKSYNRQLMEKIIELTEGKIEFDVITPDMIPLYDGDIEYPTPASVQDMRDKVRAADGIWIFSPEYNHSIPGGLKNMLDWLSRPMGEGKGQAMNGVKCAVSGVTPGISGTLNMQDDLMAFLCFLKADIMLKNKIYFNAIDDAEDENGIIDFSSRMHIIEKMIEDYIEFLECDKVCK